MTKLTVDIYYNRPRAVKVRVEPDYIFTPRTPHTSSQAPYTAFLVMGSVAVAALVVIMVLLVGISGTKQSPSCDEILQERNYYTGKLDTVCEITLKEG